MDIRYHFMEEQVKVKTVLPDNAAELGDKMLGKLKLKKLSRILIKLKWKCFSCNWKSGCRRERAEILEANNDNHDEPLEIEAENACKNSKVLREVTENVIEKKMCSIEFYPKKKKLKVSLKREKM
jgi:hypothetical protein